MKRRLALFCLAVFLAGLLAAWLLRFRVVDAVVERRLAAAGVPASYRLTRVGPFRERIEDVRIGNPAAPDLTARRVDLSLGYTAAGPVVRSVQADGVRLNASVGPGGLTLGALDRLLPSSGRGGPALPDIDLRLREARLALATPYGRITASLDGSGNPQRRFQGQAEVASPDLRVASCALAGVDARLRVDVRGGAPRADGDAALQHTACPGLTLGMGRARVGLQADRSLHHLMATAALDGFGGRAGPVRFAGVTGPVTGDGEAGAFRLGARLRLAAASTPTLARAVAHAGPSLAATPIGPTLARARGAVVRLLDRADAEATVDAHLQGGAADVHVRRLRLTGQDGARLLASERGGLTWTGAGWRVDADVTGQGGALPLLRARLRQTKPGAPLTATAQVGPYRAGVARLAIPALRVTWADRRATFDTQWRVDGPVADGVVTELAFRIRGEAGADGRFVIGPGCQRLSFGELRIGAFILADGAVPICGQPFLAERKGGTVRLGASAGPLALRGRTSGGAPLTLEVASAALSQGGFLARNVAVSLGAGPTPTRFAFARLDGDWRPSGVEGAFGEGSARIGTVPLAFTEAEGRWRLTGGTLHLAGGLRVGDAAPSPRFRTLAADQAVLDLASNVIRATATLREPAGGAAVARVDVTHDLATGSGRALLAADAIAFTPKGLQPDQITPLTLGVVANVSGTVSGQGQIDWSPAGTTSRGSFGTDKLDLAAPFGPVTGLRGRIEFTDLLNLVSAPDQIATVAEINPGVAISNGSVRFHLPGQNRIAVDDARWPFAGGVLRLDPTVLDFGADVERRLTFRIVALDAAAFVQQLDFPNIAATGTFDGVLPMVFGQAGGRVEGGSIVARPPGGSLSYVGELTTARLGLMGKLAFDALKAIRYSALTVSLDGQLDGEMVSRVSFSGVREATPDRNLAARLLRNLPFRFNITIHAPFRGLAGTARSYFDPQLLLQAPATPPPSAIQPPASGVVP